jgi:hypothetical protein
MAPAPYTICTIPEPDKVLGGIPCEIVENPLISDVPSVQQLMELGS